MTDDTYEYVEVQLVIKRQDGSKKIITMLRVPEHEVEASVDFHENEPLGSDPYRVWRGAKVKCIHLSIPVIERRDGQYATVKDFPPEPLDTDEPVW